METEFQQPGSRRRVSWCIVNREDWPAPSPGAGPHFLTVRDVARSRRFYADIYGGEVMLEEIPLS